MTGKFVMVNIAYIVNIKILTFLKSNKINKKSKNRQNIDKNVG